jgi:hypothetical protein
MKYFTFIGLLSHIIFFIYSLFSIFNTSFNVADWGTNVEGFTILSVIAIPLTLIIIFFSYHDNF